FICDPPDRVRLPRAIRPRTGRPRLRVDHGDLHLGGQRLQEPDVTGGTQQGLRETRWGGTTMTRQRLVMQWNLRQVMASRGLFQTSDLLPLLAERDVFLTRQFLYKLVTKVPQRVNIVLLAALCDILDCTPNDLLQPRLEAVEEEPTASGDTGPG